jgi:hypothetical protein
MDPGTIIGLVAAAAQLLEQGATVLKYMNGLYRDVKNAPMQAEILLHEMNTTLGVVASLKFTLDHIPSMISESQQKPVTDSIKILVVMLQDVMKRCDKSQTTGLGRLRWPIEAKEMDKYIDRIQRYRGLLAFALQNEQLYTHTH